MTVHTIFFGADHAGYELKEFLIKEAKEWGHTIIDCGTDNSETPVDYPDIATIVAQQVLERHAAGVLICNTGIGMSIAANRYPGIRAALCYNMLTARLGRSHNNANVLTLGAGLLGPVIARECLSTFLSTTFERGRHERRLYKIDPPLPKGEG